MSPEILSKHCQVFKKRTSGAQRPNDVALWSTNDLHFIVDKEETFL